MRNTAPGESSSVTRSVRAAASRGKTRMIKNSGRRVKLGTEGADWLMPSAACAASRPSSITAAARRMTTLTARTLRVRALDDLCAVRDGRVSSWLGSPASRVSSCTGHAESCFDLSPGVAVSVPAAAAHARRPRKATTHAHLESSEARLGQRLPSEKEVKINRQNLMSVNYSRFNTTVCFSLCSAPLVWLVKTWWSFLVRRLHLSVHFPGMKQCAWKDLRSEWPHIAYNSHNQRKQFQMSRALWLNNHVIAPAETFWFWIEIGPTEESCASYVSPLQKQLLDRNTFRITRYTVAAADLSQLEMLVEDSRSKMNRLGNVSHKFHGSEKWRHLWKL